MSFELIQNPVDVASLVAQTRFTDTSFGGSPEDVKDIIELNCRAEDMGMIGLWSVDATRGFIIPDDVNTDTFTCTILNDLSFDGYFSYFSRVAVGKFMGDGAVRAVCLTFPSGNLTIPKSTPLDHDDLLYIPVMAVKNMTRLESDVID